MIGLGLSTEEFIETDGIDDFSAMALFTSNLR